MMTFEQCKQLVSDDPIEAARQLQMTGIALDYERQQLEHTEAERDEAKAQAEWLAEKLKSTNCSLCCCYNPANNKCMGQHSGCNNTIQDWLDEAAAAQKGGAE